MQTACVSPLLNASNYAKGFLVDNEVIGGVTEMAGIECRVFSAYVSHQQTGETFDYQEFRTLNEALEYLNKLPRRWTYESIGCSSGGCGSHEKTQPLKTASACQGCSCK